MGGRVAAGGWRKPPWSSPAQAGRSRQGANQGMTSRKPRQRQGFKTGEFIVYPAYGVG
jgi:hypothetical protein